MDEENNVNGNIGHVDSLKDKLRQVTSEIDSIKNSFSKSTEELARLQKMLDVENVDEISGMMEKFEKQVADAERKRVEAAEGAKKYSEELEKEKERLIKLWDAYKNQEQELSETEKKLSGYEEKMRNFESEKQQIESDYTGRMQTLENKVKEYEEKANSYDEYKGRVEEFDSVRNRLEGEIHSLKENINTKDQEINTLTQQVNDLKQYEGYAEYKTKWEETNAEYEKEKERLTKLYQLYEETDTECKRLRNEQQNWQSWFNSNKEIFDKLFSAPPMPTQTPAANIPPAETQNTIEPPTTSTPGQPTDEKTKKKKLKFRK